MSIKSLRSGYKGISALAGNVPPGDFESIQTVTVASTAAAIEFTSIPSTYQHLQIRSILRTDRNDDPGDYIEVQVNGVTSSSYAYHGLYGNGSSTGVEAGSSQTSMNFQRVAAGSSSTNVFGVSIIDVLDYANTNKNTTLRHLGGFDNNGSGWATLYSGLYSATTAITSVKIMPGIGSNFVQNTHAALYGIRG
jgi:hypothetical protein